MHFVDYWTLSVPLARCIIMIAKLCNYAMVGALCTPTKSSPQSGRQPTGIKGLLGSIICGHCLDEITP